MVMPTQEQPGLQDCDVQSYGACLVITITGIGYHGGIGTVIHTDGA